MYVPGRSQLESPQSFQTQELPQFLKLTVSAGLCSGLTAGTISRNSGPNLPHLISLEMWQDSWKKSSHSLMWSCNTLMDFGPTNRKHFHPHN